MNSVLNTNKKSIIKGVLITPNDKKYIYTISYQYINGIIDENRLLEKFNKKFSFLHGDIDIIFNEVLIPFINNL